MSGAREPGAPQAPHFGDDRELWDGPSRARAIKLIQGYVWHPKEEPVDLRAQIPAELMGAHVLIDAMPRAPFTFFDDGTPSASQCVYQLTVVRLTEPGEDPGQLLEAVAEELGRHLDKTPPAVGWQLMDDLREVD